MFKMDPNHKKLKALLTDTVLQFCRQNRCFEDELRIQGTVCVTSDSCSFFVTQLSEIFNFTGDEKDEALVVEPQSPGQTQQKLRATPSPSPKEEQKNRRWIKRKTLLQPSSTALKKVKSAESAGIEVEPGVVKIEQDGYSPPGGDSSVESAPGGAHISGFLGFGDDLSRLASAHGFPPNKDSPLVGELVMGEIPIEYSYNQAEYIAAMNRHGTGATAAKPDVVEDSSVLFNKTKEPTNYLQHVEKKEPDKYKCTLCGKEYSNRGSIYRHIDKHMGRNFSCDYCGSTFESHSGWTRHIRTIHAQHMNFSCDKCPQKFYQKNALDQHYTRIHLKDDVRAEAAEAAENSQHNTAQNMQSNSPKE